MTIDGARFVAPIRGATGCLLDALANCRRLRAIRRFILARLPFLALASDVRDIVYANWVVPVDRVAALVPPGVTLWERDGRTILTILTYRHGHFGPRIAGPLRRLFPSPLQSNWRLYADDARSGLRLPAATVLFVRNIFDSALYAVGTRLVSDALPSHWAGRFVHDAAGPATRTIIAGGGSSPELTIEARGNDARTLPPDFAGLFATWGDAISFLCLQDGALAAVEEIGAVAFAGIDLPIDPATAEPLVADRFAPTALLRDWGVDAAPFCFRVPAVHFRVLSERIVAG